jgi:release factor glutamine methyltransferase
VRLTELIGEATATLAAAHVASPRVDAELLAAFVIGVPRSRLLGAPNPTPAQVERFRYLVTERAARRPLQHLTGTAPFRHLVLRVGHGVFVPRPETERLVEWGLDWLRDHPSQRVVDLCSGSGAIALSVAAEASDPYRRSGRLSGTLRRWSGCGAMPPGHR